MDHWQGNLCASLREQSVFVVGPDLFLEGHRKVSSLGTQNHQCVEPHGDLDVRFALVPDPGVIATDLGIVRAPAVHDYRYEKPQVSLCAHSVSLLGLGVLSVAQSIASFLVEGNRQAEPLSNENRLVGAAGARNRYPAEDNPAGSNSQAKILARSAAEAALNDYAVDTRPAQDGPVGNCLHSSDSAMDRMVGSRLATEAAAENSHVGYTRERLLELPSFFFEDTLTGTEAASACSRADTTRNMLSGIDQGLTVTAHALKTVNRVTSSDDQSTSGHCVPLTGSAAVDRNNRRRICAYAASAWN